jgi:hypothetical protein
MGLMNTVFANHGNASNYRLGTVKGCMVKIGERSMLFAIELLKKFFSQKISSKNFYFFDVD